MKKFLFFISSICLLTACDKPYTVILNYGEENNGKQVTLKDHFTRDSLGSAIVTDGKVVFDGKTDHSFVATAITDERATFMIIEPDTIEVTINPMFSLFYEITGTEQNDSLSKIIGAEMGVSLKQMLSTITLDAKASDFEARRDSITQSCEATLRALYKENASTYAGTPLGDYCVEQWLSKCIGKAEFDEAYSHVSSSLKNAPSIQKLAALHQGVVATQPGGKFIDFTIENGTLDGKSVSLSDYVGRGKYVLVDYWASWCAPCRGTIPSVKELYKKYAGDKFEVVSVAVWDEREASLKAIEEEQMPWPQIVDAQKTPSDIYGFTGIPQVMLFAPDGTMVARDLLGSAITEAVEKVME